MLNIGPQREIMRHPGPYGGVFDQDSQYWRTVASGQGGINPPDDKEIGNKKSLHARISGVIDKYGVKVPYHIESRIADEFGLNGIHIVTKGGVNLFANKKKSVSASDLDEKLREMGYVVVNGFKIPGSTYLETGITRSNDEIVMVLNGVKDNYNTLSVSNFSHNIKTDKDIEAFDKVADMMGDR